MARANIYRISIFAQWGNFQFNHFLVKDDEPLLFHGRVRFVISLTSNDDDMRFRLLRAIESGL